MSKRSTGVEKGHRRPPHKTAKRRAVKAEMLARKAAKKKRR